MQLFQTYYGCFVSFFRRGNSSFPETIGEREETIIEREETNEASWPVEYSRCVLARNGRCSWFDNRNDQCVNNHVPIRQMDDLRWSNHECVDGAHHSQDIHPAAQRIGHDLDADCPYAPQDQRDPREACRSDHWRAQRPRVSYLAAVRKQDYR